MRTIRTIAIPLLLLASVGCRASRTESSLFDTLGDPFADPAAEYRFGEGSRYQYAEDDRLVLTIEVRNARLYCNDQDTGPYEPGTPVRILSRSELLVAGERRAIPPRPGPVD